MTHDIQDLLDLIMMLENRVLDLEKLLKDTVPISADGVDRWYWDY